MSNYEEEEEEDRYIDRLDKKLKWLYIKLIASAVWYFCCALFWIIIAYLICTDEINIRIEINGPNIHNE